MGHLRDLPKSKLGVDIENGFEPSFNVNMKDKESIIKEIKKKAKKSDMFILRVTRIVRERLFHGIWHRF